MTSYQDYMRKRSATFDPIGFTVEDSDLNPALFQFQKDIVKWSLRTGRTLLGQACGLGKGPQLMEWCQQVSRHTGKPVIMFAPPGVKTQFKYEAAKFGYTVNVVNEESELVTGTNITNYERLIKTERIKPDDIAVYFEQYQNYDPIESKRTSDWVEIERFRFDPRQFGGIALDEGSILKDFGAKTRERLTRFAELGEIPFRVAGTATPAPNDYEELMQYAEFLGIMTVFQCRAIFFIQKDNQSSKYKIKDWAWTRFWEWVASWAVMIQKPSDLGYPDNGYVLPKMETRLHVLDDNKPLPGMLMAIPANSLSEQAKLKRNSVEERCQLVADIVNNDPAHWVVWCELNDESQLLTRLIPGAVEVTGSHPDDYKEQKLMGFARGEFRVIITKPSIGGLGLNWQEHCHKSISVTVDHSYEKQYQYIRRIWRFGQTKDVEIHLVAMSTEGDILANIARKERQAQVMFDEIKKQMNIHDLKKGAVKKGVTSYKMDSISGQNWELYLGDSCELVHKLEDRSIHGVITSVPFPAMYAYTDLPHDIGNHFDVNETVEHLGFVFKPLLAKMVPGRLCSIHVSQAVAQKNREGYIGLVDWIGPLIKMMTEGSWIYHNQITIEKDPQTERARNNTLGLMFKTLATDAANMRCSNADYVVQFRAPGENPEPIQALLASKENGNKYDSHGWITQEMWINWASNVWYRHRAGMKWWEGVNVTNVLGSKRGYTQGMGSGVRDARDEKDEKHLCELQLDVIERLAAVWSNPGDVILDPFNGIGSTGWQVLQMGRRYIGFELKETYYHVSIKNLEAAERSILQPDLFSISGVSVNETPQVKAEAWKSHRQISLTDKHTNWATWGNE